MSASSELTQYIKQARQSGLSDDQILQELVQSGWNPTDINSALSLTPISPIPTDIQSSAEIQKQTSPPKGRLFLTPLIFFIVVLGINVLIGYQQAVLSSKTFMVGMIATVFISTAVFSLLTILIRKIGNRFGLRWKVASWILVSFLPIGFLGFIFWEQNQVSPSVKAFQEKSFYKTIPGEWKTYINEPFSLSLRYPSTMKLDEVPHSYGFDDVFTVNLESTISSTTGVAVTVNATTDKSKCDDLWANTSLIPKNLFTYKKVINGREFLVGSASTWTAYGSAMEVFGYFQQLPICKVVTAAFVVPLDLSSSTVKISKQDNIFSARQKIGSAAQDVLFKIDYAPMLETAESIIGSMSDKIIDDGSANVTHVHESDSALYSEMTRISSSRLVAFRIYNSKSAHSYVGTCEDAVFKSLDPDMTCRESPNEFIMYYKINDKFGYACGDTNWYGSVEAEPTGFSCNGAQTSSVSKGVSVDGKYNHIKTSEPQSFLDCGILSYKDNTEQQGGIGNSDCFNKAITSCKSAVISGVVDGFVSTYRVFGNQQGQCKLTQQFFKQVSSNETQSGLVTCDINPSIGWSSISNCIQSY